MDYFKSFILLFILFPVYILQANEYKRWSIHSDNNIIWHIDDSIPHKDHLEMSGRRISAILRYGINSERGFEINKSLVWPFLRTIPNNTHASLVRKYDWDVLDCITINGESLLSNEKVKEVVFGGTLRINSFISNNKYGSCKLTREYFPSTDKPTLVEMFEIVNCGKKKQLIEIPYNSFVSYTNPSKGVKGSYRITGVVDRHGYYSLKPNDTLRFSAFISANFANEETLNIDAEKEKKKRLSLINEWVNDCLILETPDSVINTMFALSKIRACESIYETQCGPMHGPGGEVYYAAIWANDEAEYINPYFPFVGYDYGNLSALNSYRLFARYINKEWKPIPSSIIAEGLYIWNGAGDRGDAAMIAYGAARYVLAMGRKEIAEELWPLITWCLEYCNRKLNEGGVVASDTDELENRFESGKANLCTSSLYYDALISASYIAKELGKDLKLINEYKDKSELLRKNIESYFGANVEGYKTYAYYKGNDVLRSWICAPLAVGIDERVSGTIDALFSTRLWTVNGLLTQAGNKTYWDRSTLYALRGVYIAGETEKANKYLHIYSSNRLLGSHVPYAIEAWPQGGQRQISAESGLYGRIITEGMFGIRPTGFKSFDLTPRLAKGWNKMSLKNINAFYTNFNIEIQRLNNNKIKIIITEKLDEKIYVINDGDTIKINVL